MCLFVEAGGWFVVCWGGVIQMGCTSSRALVTVGNSQQKVNPIESQDWVPQTWMCYRLPGAPTHPCCAGPGSMLPRDARGAAAVAVRGTVPASPHSGLAPAGYLVLSLVMAQQVYTCCSSWLTPPTKSQQASKQPSTSGWWREPDNVMASPSPSNSGGRRLWVGRKADMATVGA